MTQDERNAIFAPNIAPMIEMQNNPDCANCGKGYGIGGTFNADGTRQFYHVTTNGFTLHHVALKSAPTPEGGDESLDETGFLLAEANKAALEWLNCERHSKRLGPLSALPDCDDSNGKRNVALRMLRATSIIALHRSRPSPAPRLQKPAEGEEG